MLSHKTINALKLYRDMLMNQGPRSLCCRSTNTWYFFTEASYEVDGDLPVAGHGGVLVSPVGKPVRLNPGKAKTIIFECEFLAVLKAYKAWAKEIAGSQLIVFIDNNAVRDRRLN